MRECRTAPRPRTGAVRPPDVNDSFAGACSRRGQRRDIRDCECHPVDVWCASALPAQEESDPDQHRCSHRAPSQEPVPNAIRTGLDRTRLRWRFDRVLQRRRILAPEVTFCLSRRHVAICRGPERDQFLERSNPIARETQDDAAFDRPFPLSR